jgi:serine/threonine protein kinase
MHRFHLVHLDLKPPNIMFSPSLSRSVFIDFGFSRIIKENIGETSSTKFVGSYSFCSENMKKCLLKRETENRVNLYYNDLFGLIQSIKILSAIDE